MSNNSLFQLKKRFRDSFPKEYELLELAKTQQEIDELHERFVEKAREDLRTALKNDGVSDEDIHTLSTTPVDETAAFPVTPERYESLIDARKGQIQNEVHALIDVLTRLQKLHSNELGLAAATLVISGMLAISGLAIRPAFAALFAGETEAAAVVAGVTTLTMVSLIAIVTFLIIIVLIPILFYMQKPANCVVLLINELDKEIIFAGDHNIHGKPKLMTTPIHQAVIIPGYGTYAVCGLIATAKTKNAFYGTQYGFTMKYGNTRLSFGVENPLTSLYKDNNCYCEIDTSAEDVAKKTDHHNKQEWVTNKGGITLSIRCNSGHGSTSYYIARAYKTP